MVRGASAKTFVAADGSLQPLGPSCAVWLTTASSSRAAFDDNVVRQLDGAEVVLTNAYASNPKAEEIKSFYRRVEENGRHLTAIGSSDYHWFNSLGISRTYVFAHQNDEPEIIDAVRAGRTVVFDRDGNAYGNSELIRLLQDEPITREVSNYQYRGSGIVDVITRTLGWLGLIGLLLFGRNAASSGKQ
jgi:hypothetical protein